MKSPVFRGYAVIYLIFLYTPIVLLPIFFPQSVLGLALLGQPLLDLTSRSNGHSTFSFRAPFFGVSN